MNNNLPFTRDLVLIGGGHTHALVLRKWGMNPLPGVRVTVINPGPTAPYSGMLPGFVAGHYVRDELDIDLVRLCRFAGARLIDGAATRLDRAAQVVHVAARPPIAYDVAAIDVGITSAMPEMKGFSQHAVPAKPLGAFASCWARFRQETNDPHVAVIGGGVAGAELALAMSYALNSDGKVSIVQLIDRGRVLKDLGERAREKMLNALTEQNVRLIENANAVQIGATEVMLLDGRVLRSDFTIGAAGAQPHGWLSDIGVEMHNGFVKVNAELQSSDPNIFAVGDCAHLSANPRPKAGVFAVREAPVLFENLRAVLSGRGLRQYKPQRDYLKLISLGGKVALAEKFGTARKGPLLWKWKDNIDRKFMRKFDELPTMPGPKIPRAVAVGVIEALGDKPMCGGCGAKVGRGALRHVLADMPTQTRDDVVSIAGDDAAVLVTGGQRQVISTDHLRAMTHDPVLMTQIAAVHALGDIWGMGAAPQAATANIILPRMSAELQRRTLTEIMKVATDVMQDAGAVIVGGHSSLGDELTIGFTVTGLCTRAPITIAGAKPGDVLILTKPLGSGVIMAAEMARRAKGADVLACLAHMVQPQGVASAILQNAHAMTDVTGFGLAGHLAGILEASGVGAELTLDAIPLMQGAIALAEGGVRSTLFSDNRDGAGPVFGASGPRSDLLFDPQTAGGLLAAVSAKSAAQHLTALRDAGYAAAIIGTLSDQAGVIRVV